MGSVLKFTRDVIKWLADFFIGFFSSGLTRFILRRILIGLVVLFLVTLFTFITIRLVPGGPFEFFGSRRVPPQVMVTLNQRYGLDKPLLLNLPNDGVAPDNGMKAVIPPPDELPECNALLNGVPANQTRLENQEEEGWYLLRLVDERRVSSVMLNGRARPCITVSPVLYSDLTRSQFGNYVFNLMRLDFGLSIGQVTRGTPVIELIADELPVSARLGVLALIIGMIFGIPLGIVSAIYRNTPVDGGINIFMLGFASIPTIAIGPFMIVVFVNSLKLLPSVYTPNWLAPLFTPEYLGQAALPLFLLSFGIATGITRLTRASLLQVLRDDYIRTARAKGLRERRVTYIHALKNAMIPVATILGPLLAGLLTGTLLLERIFGIPGIGNTLLESINARDYNLLTGITIIYSAFLIAGNIMVDIMYAWLDPRIRFD